MRLGGILRRKNTKNGKKITCGEEDVKIKTKRYFEREEPLSKKITPKQLEKKINNILLNFDGYGNVIVELQSDSENSTLRVYTEEMDTCCIYFCRVCISNRFESVEQIIEDWYRNQDISSSAKLVDVVRYGEWKILIFKE